MTSKKLPLAPIPTTVEWTFPYLATIGTYIHIDIGNRAKGFIQTKADVTAVVAKDGKTVTITMPKRYAESKNFDGVKLVTFVTKATPVAKVRTAKAPAVPAGWDKVDTASDQATV